MEEKQTAVDWLEDRLDNLLELYASEWDKVSNLINQAKAMEKKQIETAYNAGREFGCKHDDAVNGEEYYKQTFKAE